MIRKEKRDGTPCMCKDGGYVPAIEAVGDGILAIRLVSLNMMLRMRGGGDERAGPHVEAGGCCVR